MWSDDGVPWCDDDCPHHDGKRCKAIGFRPSTICEPAVVQQARIARGNEGIVATWRQRVKLTEHERDEAIARAERAEAETVRGFAEWSKVRNVVEAALAWDEAPDDGALTLSEACRAWRMHGRGADPQAEKA